MLISLISIVCRVETYPYMNMGNGHRMFITHI